MAEQRFSVADIDRWVAEGLITSDQREALLDDLSGQQPVERGLNLVTLLYYAGGLLVLLSYGIFLAAQWQDLDEPGRLAISLASLAAFAIASEVLLRNGRFQLPGELLQVVAVAVVPLLAFVLLDGAGLVPDDPGFRAGRARNEDYQTDLSLIRMALFAATFGAATLAFLRSRSPYAMAAAAVSLGGFVLDVSILFEADFHDYEWATPQALVLGALGVSSVAAGIASRDASDRNYSLWLYLMGLAAMGIGLGMLAFEDDGAAGWGILWLAATGGVLALSLSLQERVFAAAGIAAFFAYASKLAFDAFGEANAALVLVVIGLLILGIGILYQRYNERLFSRPTS